MTHNTRENVLRRRNIYQYHKKCTQSTTFFMPLNQRQEKGSNLGTQVF